MRNTILVYLVFILLQINGFGFKLTIDQVNSKTIKLTQNQKCDQSFCFVGDTVLTVQSDSQRITSLTLQNSSQKLVLPACPSSNVLTFNNDENVLQLLNSKDNNCYPYSNNFLYKEDKWYDFILNALLDDQKTYQYFQVQVNITDDVVISSSTPYFCVQVSMLIFAILLLI